MSNVSVEKLKLDVLATAISNKSGVPLTLTLTEMVDAVDGIQTGGGGGEPNLQTKTATYTPTESQQTATITPDSGYDGLSSVGITVNAVSSTYVGTGITRRSSTDLTASGATVTVPSGYYASQASKAVATGTAGTPTATKGSVSNHSISVTPSVTNTSGYITGSTKTGTAVTVTASELVSGSETKTANGTYDVTNLAELVVNVSGGGGASNFVTGTFTGTTAQKGTAIDINLPYTGSGYPVSIVIYPSDGPYNSDSTFYNLIQRYACCFLVGIKSIPDARPTYSSSTSNNNMMAGYQYRKNSTSSATTYSGTAATGSGIYLNSDAAANNALGIVRFKSATRLSVFIANTSYGFAAGIEYTYQVAYSE